MTVISKQSLMILETYPLQGDDEAENNYISSSSIVVVQETRAMYSTRSSIGKIPGRSRDT